MRGLGTGPRDRYRCGGAGAVRYGQSGPGEAARLHQRAAESTRRFLDLLRVDLLESRNVRIAPEAFFAQGTEAIRHAFALLDHLGEVLQRRLQEEARRSRHRRTWRRAASLALQAGAVTLASVGV